MLYGEKISEALRNSGVSSTDVTVPLRVVKEALSLRNEVLSGSPDTLFDLSRENTRLFQSRIIGGASTRLFLGSYIASQQDGTVEYIGNLPESSQAELLAEIDDHYKLAAADTLGSNTKGWDVFSVPMIADVLPELSNEDTRSIISDSKKAELSRVDRFKTFAQYLNPIPGTYPVSSWRSPDYTLNDVILTQAFGRNSVPDKELPELERTRHDLGSDLAMFEFLSSTGFDAGVSNEALAKRLIEELTDESKVVEHAAQWETVYALWELQPDIYDRYSRYIHVLWPKGSFYPTYAVKADSIDVMDKVGLYNPIEFAHPDMMVRAVAILGKLGVQPDIMRTEVPFDPKSVQAQVRGEVPWTVRETLTRVEHLVFGRVSF